MNRLNDKAGFIGMHEHETSVSTNETYWGYIVRCQNCDRSVAIVLQWVLAFVGMSLLVAALGFWLLPGSAMSPDVTGLKLAMSTLSGVLGVTLIWFASHGKQYEIHVDLARSELREVLRNEKGNVRVQNRMKFEDVEAVFIEFSEEENAKSNLMLRLANSTHLIEVAHDHEKNLVRLHDRLTRDILGKYKMMRTKPNRGSILGEAAGVIKPEVAA